MSNGKSKDALTAIGLMAGTSLDGIDVVVLRTDGTEILEHGPVHAVPYRSSYRGAIKRATKAVLEGRREAADIDAAERLVTTAHIEAVQELLRREGLSAGEIDVIGFHGQTILHRPPEAPGEVGATWQLGDGAAMAAALGTTVVDGFRSADMQRGGQGAPFAPVYHAALAKRLAESAPIAVLNLGGVANLTFVPSDGASGGARDGLMAFDCGPGNGLIDQYIEERTGEKMDTDGALAQAGRVSDEALSLLLLNPFLKKAPPKSLDRYDFKLGPVADLSTEDGAATLTAFTAACVARGLSQLPDVPVQIITCGGGRHNPALMAALRAAIEMPVVPAEAVGWRGDDVEAECFAFLAVRALKGMPLSYPNTTGVAAPTTGGVVHEPEQYRDRIA